jgi:hypothetical protein
MVKPPQRPCLASYDQPMVRTEAMKQPMKRTMTTKREKPTHKQCRQCGEWFKLRRYASPTQRFCTVGCWTAWRNAQPEWRKAQSAKIKAQTDSEVMRTKSLGMSQEARAKIAEATRKRANSKQHLAWMAKHNEQLWSDKEFRKRHAERSREQVAKQWTDPTYRQKMSAQTTELNKKRWADPDFRERTSHNIRIALLAPLEKKRRLETARRLAQTSEHRERASNELKARWADPEQRALMSAYSRETQLKKWSDPEYRKKQKAAWTPERRAAQARRIAKTNVVRRVRDEVKP